MWLLCVINEVCNLQNHLDIRYDIALRNYVIMDLGSKNGTILNGTRISESQVVSKPIEVSTWGIRRKYML